MPSSRQIRSSSPEPHVESNAEAGSRALFALLSLNTAERCADAALHLPPEQLITTGAASGHTQQPV